MGGSGNLHIIVEQERECDLNSNAGLEFELKNEAVTCGIFFFLELH